MPHYPWLCWYWEPRYLYNMVDCLALIHFRLWSRRKLFRKWHFVQVWFSIRVLCDGGECWRRGAGVFLGPFKRPPISAVYRSTVNLLMGDAERHFNWIRVDVLQGNLMECGWRRVPNIRPGTSWADNFNPETSISRPSMPRSTLGKRSRPRIHSTRHDRGSPAWESRPNDNTAIAPAPAPVPASQLAQSGDSKCWVWGIISAVWHLIYKIALQGQCLVTTWNWTDSGQKVLDLRAAHLPRQRRLFYGLHACNKSCSCPHSSFVCFLMPDESEDRSTITWL